MTNRPFLLFAYILFPLNAVAQDAVKAPITVLRSQGELEEETGAAFLVGEKDGKLYYLTAAHVIADPKSIKVQFYKGATVAGQLVKSNQPLDVAVVSCAKPAGFTPPPSFALAKTSEKNLQSVIVAGHPLGNYWDINFNSNVKSTEYDLDERLFTLAPIGIAPGNSGGPVLNQQYELLGLAARVDQVNAVCVDAATLLRACQTWEIPLNLMTGVSVEKQSQSGQEDFRYQLFTQEANTAFSTKKWAQAKTAYTQADALQPTPAFKEKIQQCEVEIAKDEGYRSNLDQGKKAPDLKAALGFFQKAQANRDTEEARNLIQQCKEKLAKLGIESAKTPVSGKLPERVNDPLAGEYVLVRGGTFTMGCDTCEVNELPTHQVYLDDYYIGVFELTNDLFCKFLNEEYGTPEKMKPISKPYSAEKIGFSNINFVQKGLKIEYSPVPGRERFPIRWQDAGDYYGEVIEYCRWLSRKTGQTYRLPTEAEWEYAARGGHKGKKNPLYNRISRDNSKIKKSGLLPPNELGLYDMLGNVSEIVSDYYRADYYTTLKNQGVVANPVGFYSSGKEAYPHRVSRGETITSRSGNFFHSTGVRLVRLVHPMTPEAQITARIEQNMQLVKGGTFSMGWSTGATDHQPVHQVTVDDFYISKTEITWEQWGEVFDSYGYYPYPVSNISWDSIQQFIQKLNDLTGVHYRLPTEAEWEYAARGGSIGQAPSWWYSGSKDFDIENGVRMVASSVPNSLGLYDMTGNVAEYCGDWYQANYYFVSPQRNPTGPDSGRNVVVRGGCWGDRPNDINTLYYGKPQTNYLTVFSRNAIEPNKKDNSVGFRLVRSAKPSSVSPK
jgi:formylglycine-generating enzyme required for sulfatase activity